jgi:phosphotransferase system enzyme I (PtsI)
VADRLTGIGVSAGVAYGPVARMMAPLDLTSMTRTALGVDAEIALARDALAAVAVDLDRRAATAGGEGGKVLAAQVLMARDPVLIGRVVEAVTAGASANAAIISSFGEFTSALAAAGPYMAARVADLDDIRDRALAQCLGVPMPGVPDQERPFVLVAVDLSPAETVSLDASRVLAIVTESGGPTSHTAILAKSLGIPAVVACAAAAQLRDADQVLVDGDSGAVTVTEHGEAVEAALAQEAARRAASAIARGPGATADGHRVQLLVNLGGIGELTAAAAVESEGVGLFRTEFLFLGRTHAPSVEEQRAVYRRVFDAFSGRKVVVRTLDAGADKPLRFVTQANEPNPALGIRGLRTARRYPELLEQQLQAIAAAAEGAAADVWVMAPMVSTAAEAASFAGRVHAVGLPTAGAMVEVPAAALRASLVGAACDFLSIGTNDLGQYVFAADRMAGDLADLLDPWQPALLDLVRMTADAGHRLGRPVGVCGEAAADPLLAPILVGLGVTSLSMSPVSIAAVRSVLGSHTLAECRDMAAIALGAADARAARDGVAASRREHAAGRAQDLAAAPRS